MPHHHHHYHHMKSVDMAALLCVGFRLHHSHTLSAASLLKARTRHEETPIC